MNIFFIALRRELKIIVHHPSQIVNPLLFFVIIITLFPLAISPESSQLSIIAPGIIWVSAILSVLLSLNNLFYFDYENGVLEQMASSPHSLSLLIFAKVTAHWLSTGIPILLISPLLGVLLFLDNDSLKVLFLTLLLGTPSLSLIGVIGAALTVSLKNTGILLSLITLPLYIPVLIFAVSAISYSQQNLNFDGQLYFLAFILSLSLLLSPLLSKMAIKINLE